MIDKSIRLEMVEADTERQRGLLNPAVAYQLFELQIDIPRYVQRGNVTYYELHTCLGRR